MSLNLTLKCVKSLRVPLDSKVQSIWMSVKGEKSNLFDNKSKFKGPSYMIISQCLKFQSIWLLVKV